MSVAVARPHWQTDALTTPELGGVPIDLDQFFPASYWQEPITDYTPYQHPSIPQANSANWVANLCNQMDIDPVTGSRKPGALDSKAWMGASNPLYVVPSGYPRRPVTLRQSGLDTVGGAALSDLLNDGIPIPEDAVTENQWQIDKFTSGQFTLVLRDGPTVVTVGTVTPATSATNMADMIEAACGIRPSVTGTTLSVNYLFIRFPASRIMLSMTADTSSPTTRVRQLGDRWVNVYQPSTDSLWELYSCTRSDPEGPLDSVGWGGVVLNRVSKHVGTYLYREDAAGRVLEHPQWSGNACSIVNVPWVDIDVYADCVARGVAYPTAIPLSLGHAQRTPIGFVWPATRGDGDNYNRPDMIPEGARIVFPPGADFSRVRPEFMPMALAGQQYGFIPRDKTGLGVNLQLRNYGSVLAPKPSWTTVLTMYQERADAPNEYMMSLPWYQAIIVHPDQSR
jgi:hypothetical protein